MIDVGSLYVPRALIADVIVPQIVSYYDKDVGLSPHSVRLAV